MSGAGEARRAIFVTGAASGMGEATVRLFAERGWFVGGYDVDAAGLDRLAEAVGADRGIFGVLDVTDADAFAAALAAFGEASGGRLDLLHNNAGIIAQGLFADMEWATIERILRINLFGPMIGTRAALPLLRATRGALVMTTCSASAIVGAPRLVAYSASKHGVRGMTEGLAAELALEGIRVADVLPGIIDTAMIPPEAKEHFPAEGMWRLLPPAAVAEAVWEAYHADKVHSYVPPELIEHERIALEQPEAVRDEAAARLRETLREEDGPVPTRFP